MVFMLRGKYILVIYLAFEYSHDNFYYFRHDLGAMMCGDNVSKNFCLFFYYQLLSRQDVYVERKISD